ncbi:MAG: hypothetical protein JHD16_03855 [Solirubrobacteraceae bacterium]|nr:hypothetical protein [Solirubrobacteraceae bacterium]
MTTAAAEFPVAGQDRTFRPGIGLLDSSTPVFAYTEGTETRIRRFDTTTATPNNGANWRPTPGELPIAIPNEEPLALVSRVGVGAYLMTHAEPGDALSDVHRVRKINEFDGKLEDPRPATTGKIPRDGTLALDASGGLTSVFYETNTPGPILTQFAPAGGAFGGTGTLVEATDAFNVRAATSPDHGGLVVWDGNSAGGIKAASIPAGGVPADPPPPGTAPDPGPAPVVVSSECKLTIAPGIVASARGGVPGCWVNSPKGSKRYEYDGTVDINGLVLTAAVGKKTGVVVDLGKKTVTAPKGTQQKAGSVILSNDKVSWDFAKSKTQKFFSLETAAAGKAIKLLGFDVVGEATITFGDLKATLEPNLAMPFPFKGSAATSLKISQQSGLVLEGASFSIENAWIGPLEVKALKVVAAGGISSFRGFADVRLPGAELDIKVTVGFDDGALTQFAASVTNITGLAITPVTYLTGVGFNYQNDASGFTIGGGAEVAFPTQQGAFWFAGLGDPPGTGGGFSLHVPKGTKQAIITLGGTFQFGSQGSRLDFGTIDATLDTQKQVFSLGAKVFLGTRVLGLFGEVDGAINYGNGDFYVRGGVEVCFIGCLKSDVIASSVGVSACVDVLLTQLMVGYKWETGFDAGLSCNQGSYVPLSFRPGAVPGQPNVDPVKPKDPVPNLAAKDVFELPLHPNPNEVFDGDEGNPLQKTKTWSMEIKGAPGGGAPGVRITEAKYTVTESGNGVVTRQLQPATPDDRVVIASDPNDLKQTVADGDVVLVPNPDTDSVRLTFIQRGLKSLQGKPSNLPRGMRISQAGGNTINFGAGTPQGVGKRAQAGGGIVFARNYEPTKVQAKLSGKARSRTVQWNASNLGGSDRTVTFVEEGAGVAKTITTTKASSGRKAFKIADGPGGKRTIKAIVKNFAGLVVEDQVVARYTAPGPIVPGKATKVRFTLDRKGRLTARWGGTANSARLIVEITTADGRGYTVTTKKRSVVIPSISKKERVTVKITGVTKRGVQGRTVTARR